MKTAPQDLRSPMARARDEWFESFEGQGCANPTSLELGKDQEEYLRNRLEIAFSAGAAAMRRIVDRAITEA